MDNINPKNLHSQNLNFIKNSFQFIIGSALFFATMNGFSLSNFFIGLIGFVLSYHSVYSLNDLMDYYDDKKDDMRKHFKPLVNGKTKRTHMEAYSFLYLVIGLPLCFFVSTLFGFLVVISLLLNFLHSSPFIRLKKTRFVLPNLFFIEFIKFSLGWFALSSYVNNFPFLFVAFLSTVYVLIYTYYKQNAVNFFKSKSIVVLSIISFSLYIASIFSYPFKLALILIFPLGFILLITRKYDYHLLRVRIGTNLLNFISVCFVLSLLILSIPSVAEINNNICCKIDSIKENITEKIPENVKSEIASLDKSIKENIEKIDNIENFVKVG